MYNSFFTFLLKAQISCLCEQASVNAQISSIKYSLQFFIAFEYGRTQTQFYRSKSGNRGTIKISLERNSFWPVVVTEGDSKAFIDRAKKNRLYILLQNYWYCLIASSPRFNLIWKLLCLQFLKLDALYLLDSRRPPKAYGNLNNYYFCNRHCLSFILLYTYIFFLGGDLKFISVISDYSHASEITIDSNVWYIFKLIFKQVIMLIILKQAQTTWSRKEDVYDLHHGLTVANENLLYLSTLADLVNILSFVLRARATIIHVLLRSPASGDLPPFI